MKKITLKIDGMMCGMCEAHINDAIRRSFPQIKKVSSSHTKGEMVILADQAPEEEQLRTVIAGTGYELKSVSYSDGEEKSGFFAHFGKKK